MIHLVCPCGHSVPFPDESGRYRCSKCDFVTVLHWQTGPDALRRFHHWAAFSRPRGVERIKAKFFVTSQDSLADPTAETISPR